MKLSGMTHSVSVEATSRGAQTREKLVDAARDLFHRHGYERTSLGQILSRAGVSSSSCYHFFPTKKDLLVAVAEEYEELLQPMIWEPAFAASEDPLERILAVFDVYGRFLEASRFELGCPVGAIAMEIDDSLPEVRGPVARTFAAWRRHVADCLEIAFPWQTVEERQEVSSLVLTLIEGGLLLARSERSLEPLTAASKQLRRYLELLARTRPASQ